MKRSVGQPSKLTKETKDKLTTALVAGCSIKDSCVYADISERTYHTWAEKAVDDLAAERTSQYTQFLQEVTRAKDMAKPRLEILISKAAEKDPRTALEILARRYPQEWARKDFLSFRDKTGDPEDKDIINMPDEELIRRAKDIIERRSENTQ